MAEFSGRVVETSTIASFCRRRWRVRFPRSDDLGPYNFAECMQKPKKKSELYFNVGILNAKHTSGG